VKIKRLLYYAIVFALIGCIGGGKRKSGNYYLQHANELQIIKSRYDKLYSIQPLSVGYTDRSFKYYFSEFTTDSVRWVYNNKTGADSLTVLFSKIGYPSKVFDSLLLSMRKIQCYWIDKVKRYVDGKPAYFTYCSFGSVLINRPFVENKYYVLIFPDDKVALGAIKQSATKGGIYAINDSVFFTISNRFR
jgi:hypothetical protein